MVTTSPLITCYQRLGWKLMPVRYQSKVPTQPWTRFADTNLTQDELKLLFPIQSNVAVICGKPSGIVVIDTDGERGTKDVQDLGIPITPTARSQNGFKYFFKYPSLHDIGSKIRFMDEVDLLSDSRYVIVPPSVHESGSAYEWISSPEDTPLAELPTWVYQKLEEATKASSVPVQIQAAFTPITPGSRNTTLAQMVGKWVSKKLYVEEILSLANWYNQEYLKPPLPAKEVETVVYSIHKTDQKNNPEQYLEIDSAETYGDTFFNELVNEKFIPKHKFGFKSLDTIMGGLFYGEVSVIGARPSVGKSTFLLNISNNLINQGQSVLFFSLEMSTSEQWKRLVSLRSSTHFSKLREGNFREGQEAKTVRDAIDELKRLNQFYVCADPRPNITKIEQAMKRTGCKIGLIDYLQLCEFGRAESFTNAIGQFITELKVIARREKYVFIVASQLNRGIEQREDRKVRLSDLRDSGAIEQTADSVIFLSRTPEFNKESDVNPLLLSVEKHRNGRIGEAYIRFQPSIMRMYE